MYNNINERPVKSVQEILEKSFKDIGLVPVLPRKEMEDFQIAIAEAGFCWSEIVVINTFDNLGNVVKIEVGFVYPSSVVFGAKNLNIVATIKL